MDLKSLAASLSKQFSFYQSKHTEAANLLASVRAQISSLEVEIDAIRDAPVCRQDFLDALCSRVDADTKKGRDRVKQLVLRHAEDKSRDSPGVYRPQLAAGDFAWFHVRDVLSGQRDFGLLQRSLMTATDPQTHAAQHGLFDWIGLCALLGEPMKDAIRANVESFDWPYPDAQPTEVRLKRLAEIDVEIKSLRATETELQAIIDSASLVAV